ncbi:MAG: FHA domain-containing protein [Gemmatales bacterium]|nr:FHA domain-containing protein [Gemmatales bacterium]MCS7159024.1 FHA domain-containing protein [Gemmatales bacterium]MDW8174224.1 FHA domain-containing protein [Gemmatales bacterium]MDW8223459.1 FHA domain-containing protein [Gemmatales bacterium]
MKLTLLVKKPQGGFQEIPIRLSQFLIGRDPDCHLRPVSPMVSKRHCAILIREGRAFLKDFESTNGTYHNGRLLKGEIELVDGDEFKVGPLVFRVKLTLEAGDSSPKVPKVSDSGKQKAASAPAAESVVPLTRSEGAKAKEPAKDLEDVIAQELLLNVDKVTGQPVAPDEQSKEDLGGSTIMEITRATEDTSVQNPSAGGTPQQNPALKPKHDPKATSEAAKAILEKYLRRPRTSG